MKKLTLLALFIFFSSPAWANCPSLPYTLTNGTTADATQVMSNFNTVMNCVSSIQSPQGRLTLTSNTPVITADATAQSTVYYDCYAGSLVPVYDGAATGSIAVGSCQISLTLNSANQTSGNLYDIFAFNNSGTLTLCAGPAWSSSTTRSAAITISLGYWTNSASLTHCYNGATDYGTISANQATYLGTLYATANGQTGISLHPSGASGGTANIVGLWNAYNRVRVTSSTIDSNSPWTYGTATWRPADNSTANRVSWVDGLAATPIQARYDVNFVSGFPKVGVVVNSTTSTPTVLSTGNGSGSGNLSAAQGFYPIQGFNYAQAMEGAFVGSTTFGTNTTTILSIELEI